MKPTLQEQDEKLVKSWNEQHPIGTAVRRFKYMDLSDTVPVETKTRSEAWMLSGHTAVIMIEGKSGCVALRTCIPIE